MEETVVDMKVPHDAVSQMEALEEFRRTGKRERKTINTRNILFILSGAFNGLEDVIRRRLAKVEIGFRSEETEVPDDSSFFLRKVKAEDFIDYGFESEFVGRLPVTVVLDHLEENDLYEILRNPNCPVIVGKKADFKAYGIDIHFEDEALKLLAAMAARDRTGARALTSVVESTLIKFEKRLPSTGICRFVVTPEIVDDPEEGLRRLLESPDDPECAARFEALASEERAAMAAAVSRRADEFERLYGLRPEGLILDLAVARMVEKGTDEEEAMGYLKVLSEGIRTFQENFRENNGMRITLTPEARELLLAKAFTSGDAADFCWKHFANYPLGLQLMHDRTGCDEFEVDARAVAEPDRFLDEFIKENYTGS
jgi:hypothetical protein